MTIQFNNNIGQLNETYSKAREAMEKVHGYDKTTTRLYFSQPTMLHTTSKRSGDITATVHEVKRLFFNGGACYVPMRSKSSGYYVPTSQLEKVEILEPKTQDYRKQWQAIVNSMKKHNINLDIVTEMQQGIDGKTDCQREYCKKENKSQFHTHFAQNYWDMKSDKPKTMSFKDVLKYMQNPIEKMQELSVKSQYGNYKHSCRKNYGTQRDRSVSIQVYDDGRISYYAASEFAGCGNGDYYTMYSPTMAFYHESD